MAIESADTYRAIFTPESLQKPDPGARSDVSMCMLHTNDTNDTNDTNNHDEQRAYV